MLKHYFAIKMRPGKRDVGTPYIIVSRTRVIKIKDDFFRKGLDDRTLSFLGK